VESVLGQAAAAAKRLLCTQFDVDPNIPTVPYRPQGFLAPTTAVQQKEATSLALSGAICYNDLPYLFSSLLLAATPTTPSGATSTRRWTFNPSATGIDSFKSYTLEKGTSAQAERIVGAVVNALTMRWTRTDANLSGTMTGQATSESVTITGSPTDIAALPVDPKSVSVYAGSANATNNVQTVTITGSPTGGTFTLTFEGQTTAGIAYNANAAAVQSALTALSTVGNNVTVGGGPGPGTPYTVTFTGLFAGINATLLTASAAGLTGGTPAIAVTNTTPGGMTKLTRVSSIELAIPERYGFAYTLDDAVSSWSYAVQRGFEPRCTMVLEHDSAAAALMATLRARTTNYAKILCRGPAIETVSNIPFPAALQLSFPFKYIENSRGDVDDVYSSTYQLALMYDSTFGGFLTAAVDTSIAAL
jgi:hypothetical protein